MQMLLRTGTVAILLLQIHLTLRAHTCGEQIVRLKVGEAKLWRIVADKTEKTTSYTPSLGGPSGTVDVVPNRQFNSHHGDFVFRGLQPGTNTLAVVWFYPGPPPAGAVCVVTIIVEPRLPGETSMQIPEGNGQLSTYEWNRHIESATLHALINQHVPGQTPKLFILSECFGGNIAQSPLFKNMANTAIMTGNSPNQQGVFGGYHDDAARALAPGANKTAADIHSSAGVGRHSTHLADDGRPDDPDTTFMSSEFPTVAGGLSLSSFPLTPVSATGAVRSRHIVVYAGLPSITTPKIEVHDGRTIPLRDGTKTEITDVADRNTIKQNFANEPNTSVTTAGGTPTAGNRAGGTDGWDFSGTYEGLQAAIKKAGEEIKKSPNPELEQFILFVGDHGTQGSAAPVPQQAVSPNSRSVLATGFPSMRSGTPAVRAMEQDAANVPGFLLFLDFNTFPLDLTRTAENTFLPVFPPGALQLEITPQNRAPMLFDQFVEQSFDIDDNNRISTLPGEGLGIFFPVPEFLFLGSFVDTTLDISLLNNTARMFQVTELHQLAGSIQPSPSPLPRPKLRQPRWTENNSFEFQIEGTRRESYIIERMIPGGPWEPVQTINLTTETAPFTVPQPSPAPSTFFRATLVE